LNLTFNDKKVAILGMGEAGMSAARWLREQGAQVICVDDKAKDDWDKTFVSWCEESGVECLSSSLGKEIFSKPLDMLVVSPGIPVTHPLVAEANERGIFVVGELYLASCMWTGPLIGITGTNGKTTTTLLATHLLNETGITAVCAGNISPPLFDLFHKNDGKTCAVLEISSFQLEYFPQTHILNLKKPRFQAAVCLNVAPDHLDRHGDMAGYKRAKERLFEYQDNKCVAVLGKGAEDFNVVGQVVMLKDVRCDESASKLYIPYGNDELEINISGWSLNGRHNLENLTAAIICAHSVGSKLQQIEKALGSFVPPSHRLETIGVYNGITFIDDSKATNLHALITGLKSLEENVVLIAGGRAKGEDFSNFGKILASIGNGTGARIRGLVLIGESATEMAQSVKDYFKTVVVIQGQSGQEVMKKAVVEAGSMAKKGDVVVLSPACASFDMFSNYKERGQAYRQGVEKAFNNKC